MCGVRTMTEGGGKVPAALNTSNGADRTVRFPIGPTGKGWRKGSALCFATINGLPGVILDGLGGPVQTAWFDIESSVSRALCAVRNPDELRHLASAALCENSPVEAISTTQESETQGAWNTNSQCTSKRRTATLAPWLRRRTRR